MRNGSTAFCPPLLLASRHLTNPNTATAPTTLASRMNSRRRREGLRPGEAGLLIAHARLEPLLGSLSNANEQSTMAKRRHIIVHIAASADGYIARPDGDLDWLTSRPAPEGFYGMNAFMRSIDTKVLGRRTYEASLRLGARFDDGGRTVVFSGQPRPSDAPAGVEFVK